MAGRSPVAAPLGTRPQDKGQSPIFRAHFCDLPQSGGCDLLPRGRRAATGAERTAVPQGARAVIEVWQILFYGTELAELAARLALLSGADEFHLAAELHGMAGRALIAGTPARRHDADYISQLDVIGDARTMPVQQLTASPPQVAVDMSATLLAGFGWHAAPDVLRDHQAELLRR